MTETQLHQVLNASAFIYRGSASSLRNLPHDEKPGSIYYNPDFEVCYVFDGETYHPFAGPFSVDTSKSEKFKNRS